MIISTLVSPPTMGVTLAFYQWLNALEVSFSHRWFNQVRNLGFDMIVRHLMDYEVTFILSVPFLFRWSLTFTCPDNRSGINGVLVRESGFDISSQHVRLSWNRVLVGRYRNHGLYWIQLWRDLIGQYSEAPRVVRILGQETHHYVCNNGRYLERRKIDVEAILYAQRRRVHWPWLRIVDKQWIEIRTSEPVMLGSVMASRHHYPNPRQQQLDQPFELFKRDMLKSI